MLCCCLAVLLFLFRFSGPLCCYACSTRLCWFGVAATASAVVLLLLFMHSFFFSFKYIFRFAHVLVALCLRRCCVWVSHISLWAPNDFCGRLVSIALVCVCVFARVSICIQVKHFCVCMWFFGLKSEYILHCIMFLCLSLLPPPFFPKMLALRFVISFIYTRRERSKEKKTLCMPFEVAFLRYYNRIPSGFDFVYVNCEAHAHFICEPRQNAPLCYYATKM